MANPDDRAQAGELQMLALGEKLFMANELSADGKVSCASCHREMLAFSDGRKNSVGSFGQAGTRNAPSLLDVAQRKSLFWDGRRSSVDSLVLDPILARREHGLSSELELGDRVRRSKPLMDAYVLAFGHKDSPNSRDIRLAISAYVRTLRTGPSPFTRFIVEGRSEVLSNKQRLGYELFVGRAGCSNCHPASLADHRTTDDAFHNRVVGDLKSDGSLGSQIARTADLVPDLLGDAILADSDVAALGRFLVTHNAVDIGAFRTPALYNVAITAPYMHDGSIPSLAETVEHEIYYSMPDHGAQLDHQERSALVAFLESLTGDDLMNRARPETTSPGREVSPRAAHTDHRPIGAGVADSRASP